MKKVKILTILFSLFLIGCFASARPSKPRSEPDGFRDIKWGTEISTLQDMEKLEQDKASNSDLVCYIRNGDSLAMGDAKLERILYGFWMGNFERVWIDFKGDENFETLKKEVFEIFGKNPEFEELVKRASDKRSNRGPSVMKHPEEYFSWEGKKTGMWLSYFKERHVGTLEIWSTIISDERRTYKQQKEKEKRLKEREF